MLIKCLSLCSSFRLPVPKLEDTIRRYLNAQKPLLNYDQFRYGPTRYVYCSVMCCFKAKCYISKIRLVTGDSILILLLIAVGKLKNLHISLKRELEKSCMNNWLRKTIRTSIRVTSQVCWATGYRRSL